MSTSPKFLVHVALSTATLSDKDREHLIASISQNAPQSDLYKTSLPIQAAIADLTKVGADWTTSNATVAVTDGLLASQRQARDNKRAVVDRALTLLKGLVEHAATSDVEAKAMGFGVRPAQTTSAALPAPDGVVVKLGTKHGSFAVAARDSLYRRHFAAQISPDPLGANTWTDVPGNGKTRQLAGYASGTVLWVRFSATRGQSRSDWCAPVSVVVP